MAASLRPAEVRRNPDLFLTLCALGVIGISSQVFLPYLLIYIQYTLHIEAYALVLAVVLIGAAVAGVLGGRVIDRVGKLRAMIPALGIYVVGLLLTSVVRGLLPLIGAGLVLMSGFMLVSATVNASVRDHTPADRVGAVQGLRMVFFVLIPMVIGPSIGAAVIRGADQYYEDLGQLKQVPTPGIFVAAAVVGLLVAIPASPCAAPTRLLRSSPRPTGTPSHDARGCGRPADALGRGAGCRPPAARVPAAPAGARQLPEPQRSVGVRDHGHPRSHPRPTTARIVVPFSPETLLSGVSRLVHPGRASCTTGGRSSCRPASSLLPMPGCCCTSVPSTSGAGVVVNGVDGRRARRRVPAVHPRRDRRAARPARTSCASSCATPPTPGTCRAASSGWRRGGIWYTPQSGIWQTVWLEAVPARWIQRLRPCPTSGRSPGRRGPRCCRSRARGPGWGRP